MPSRDLYLRSAPRRASHDCKSFPVCAWMHSHALVIKSLLPSICNQKPIESLRMTCRSTIAGDVSPSPNYPRTHLLYYWLTS